METNSLLSFFNRPIHHKAVSFGIASTNIKDANAGNVAPPSAPSQYRKRLPFQSQVRH